MLMTNAMDIVLAKANEIQYDSFSYFLKYIFFYYVDTKTALESVMTCDANLY